MKYKIIFTKFNKYIELEYYADGGIKRALFHENIDVDILSQFAVYFPARLELLEASIISLSYTYNIKIITPDNSIKKLSNMMQCNYNRYNTIRKIIEQHYNVNILNNTKREQIVIARHIFRYILYKYEKEKVTVIAKLTNCNHSTVIHSNRVISNLLTYNKAFAYEFDTVKTKIYGVTHDDKNSHINADNYVSCININN